MMFGSNITLRLLLDFFALCWHQISSILGWWHKYITAGIIRVSPHRCVRGCLLRCLLCFFGRRLLLGLALGLPFLHGCMTPTLMLLIRLLTIDLFHLRICRQAHTLSLIIYHHVGRCRLAALDHLWLGWVPFVRALWYHEWPLCVLQRWGTLF